MADGIATKYRIVSEKLDGVSALFYAPGWYAVAYRLDDNGFVTEVFGYRTEKAALQELKKKLSKWEAK